MRENIAASALRPSLLRIAQVPAQEGLRRPVPAQPQ